MIEGCGRVLIHVRRGRRMSVDPDKVYLLAAAGGQTHVKTRKSSHVVDIRPLGDVAVVFQTHGFLRVHRSFMVNLRRIQEIRMRDGGGGWEIVLKPPVKDPVPVSRGMLAELWKAFGED